MRADMHVELIWVAIGNLMAWNGIGFTMLIAAVNTVLITAMATLGAFLYNMSAALLGGVEMTLTEGER